MSKPKGKTPHFDLGLLLLITGALANVTIWVGAFVATEADGPIGAWVRNVLLPILGGVSGLSMGITVTAGLVYVLARLSKLRPSVDRKVRGTKKKYKAIPNMSFYTAWAAVILLLIISPALLAPYVFMVISGANSIYAVLGDVWARAWSVGRIVAADLAMSAVALVYGVQIPALAGPTQSKPSATEPKKTVRTSKKSAAVHRTYPRKCDHCTEMIKSPNAVGAHMKKHHPELCKPKQSLAEKLFQPAETK